MKSALILGLAILKVAVGDVSEATANTWLERVSKQPLVEQDGNGIGDQQTPKTSTQAVKSNSSKSQPSTEETTLKTIQRSERDRLIQERFLIKIIPTQNQ